MNSYSHIFSSVKIGSMQVKNRLMMSAMSINFGVDEQCHVTDQLTQYFVERAKGGVGMMLVGGGSVHPGGQELPDLPVMYDDACIPSLNAMVTQVKAHDQDVKFGVQLMHGGRQSYLPKKVAPSAIPAPAVVTGEVTALGVDQIRELIACFGDASRRCRDAGFDFVEIHAAHGYLINQFMSPNANIREDQYGGSFKNRTRFLFEIIEDIQRKTSKTGDDSSKTGDDSSKTGDDSFKTGDDSFKTGDDSFKTGDSSSRAGDDFSIGIRINGSDYIENGWELEDAVRLAPLLEQAGVAYLHVSGGVYGSTELTIPSMYTAHGCFVHLADAVKKVVSIPVIAVGRIKSPELADKILSEGKADVISMGRALLADPMLPLKAREGRESEIRPCVGCCLGCIHAVLAKEPGSCVVNPDVGREYKLKAGKTCRAEKVGNAEKVGSAEKMERAEEVEKKSASQLNILVAGAGPAGMASARLFALRGHRVFVVEERIQAGGLLSLASQAPGRGELEDILNFFRQELKRLNVEIKYGKALDEEILSAFQPDKVIIATGSMPDMPMIKGLFQNSMEVVTNVDVLEGTTRIDAPGSAGKEIKLDGQGIENGEQGIKQVIVLGGGMTGLITADYIAGKISPGGGKVYVLNRKKRFAEEMSANDRYYLRESLKKKDVVLFKNVSIDRFTDRGVLFHIKGDAELKIEKNSGLKSKGKEELKIIDHCDMVVISEKQTAIRELSKLEPKSIARFHYIGDASSPRHLMHCISEAEEIALSF